MLKRLSRGPPLRTLAKSLWLSSGRGTWPRRSCVWRACAAPGMRVVLCHALALYSCGDPLPNCPKYVPRGGSPRVVRAVLGVVGHVHPGACTIDL